MLVWRGMWWREMGMVLSRMVECCSLLLSLFFFFSFFLSTTRPILDPSFTPRL